MAGEKLATERDLPVLLQELEVTDKRLMDALASTTTIMRFAILVLAGGVALAPEYPVAFLPVPILLTAWAFHALAVDRDTIRFQEYRKFLEGKLDGLTPEEFLRFEKMSDREKSQPVNWALFILFMLMGLLSWLLGSWLAYQEFGWPWGPGVLDPGWRMRRSDGRLHWWGWCSSRSLLQWSCALG